MEKHPLQSEQASGDQWREMVLGPTASRQR
jgi:hypothetical protein